MDLAKRRAKNKKYYNFSFSEGILDVIEADYNDRYVMILEDFKQIKRLFSREEWIDILTKSRNSHEMKIKRLKMRENP